MKNIKKLLLILDPDIDSDFVIQRAKLIATTYGASVHLFMSKPNAVTPDTAPGKGIGSLFFKSQNKLFIEHYEKMLQVLRGEFSAAGIKVKAEFNAEKNNADVMLKKIMEYKPDITLKSIQKRHGLTGMLISNTDWHLIKNSPYPLLVVKSLPWKTDGSIIAAVDPLHAKAQQNELDDLLIMAAEQLSKGLGLNTRVFHSYLPELSTMFPKLLDADDYIREVKRKHEEKLTELLQRHNLGMDQLILSRGNLIRSLVNCVKKEKGNILVLGALSRNMVERAIVGSTAERILYDVPCDVLVMKNA